MNKKEKQKALQELYKTIDDLYDYVQRSEECAKHIDNEDLQKLRHESVSLRYNHLYLSASIIDNVFSIPVAHEILDKMARFSKEKFIEKYLKSFLARVEVEAFGKSRFGIPVKDLLERFNYWYENFYNMNDHIKGFEEAVEEFGNRLNDEAFQDAIKKFNNERIDFISSDREAAAFVFALKETAGF